MKRVSPSIHDAHSDPFGPRPPAGYSSIIAPQSQILLPLTVSNKCGQAFRWRGIKVWEPLETNRSAKLELDAKPSMQAAVKAEIPAANDPAKASWIEQTEWSLCLADRVILLRQYEERGFLYHRTLLASSSSSVTLDQVDAETEEWLRDYLSLEVPLEMLYQEWAERDKVFARFAERFTGLRMLRQDPWECLCAFICSSNNNIARIGQMVQNLCTHFSPLLLSHTYPPCPLPVSDPDEVQPSSVTIHYHPFPPPEALAGDGVEEKLRELGFGYRAKYIATTARMLCDKHTLPHLDEQETKWSYGIKRLGALPVETPAAAPLDGASPHSVRSYLESLRKLDYQEARQHLLQFPGIGPKVADCILLMSLDQPSSIPVDRHVFQFAEKWYGIRSKKYEDIAQRFRDLWGEYAGWAHSVLFTADLRSFAEYGKVKKEEKQEEGDEIKPVLTTPTKRKVKEEPLPDAPSLAERIKSRRRTAM